MTITRRNHGGGHSYQIDGAKVPGVTTILKMTPKPALIEWAGRVTAEYAVDYWDELAGLKPSERLRRLNRARFEDRDTAARRGTEVHRLAEQLVAGRQVTVPDPLADHVRSYIAWLDAWGIDPIGIELVVANRTIGYCGTVDLICDMSGATVLAEIKTSRSGVFSESALQACAYQRAEVYVLPGDETEHPMSDWGIDQCVAVHVRSDGYDVRPLDTGPAVWSYYQHLVALHAADEDKAGWVGEAIEPLRAVS